MELKEKDSEDLKTFLEGDMKGFENIYFRYKNRIEHYFLASSNQDSIAEDLYQEVMVKVYNKIGTYSPEFGLSTWIFKIAKNTLIDYIRKSNSNPLTNSDELKKGMITFQQNYDVQERNLLEEKIIKCFPRRKRKMMKLWREGYSYGEISDLVGEKVNTIKPIIHRTRKEIIEKVLEKDSSFYD